MDTTELAALVEKLDPDFSIVHETEDGENAVTCEVYDLGDTWVFGYAYEWEHDSGCFYESAPKSQTDAQTARQYAMNGGGDLAAENDVPWNPNWLDWIRTGRDVGYPD